MLLLFTLAQTTAPLPPPPEPPQVTFPELIKFDLAELPPLDAGCGRGLGDDITVCARRTDLWPDIAALDLLFQPKPFRPRFDVAGGEVGASVEQRATLSGSAPALMLHFKLPF